jgi:hypothetical protein
MHRSGCSRRQSTEKMLANVRELLRSSFCSAPMTNHVGHLVLRPQRTTYLSRRIRMFGDLVDQVNSAIG